MNTKEQWEYEFDKLFVEQGNHRGGKVVREEASKIFDFIRETREQAKKEERERILKLQQYDYDGFLVKCIMVDDIINTITKE